MRAYGWSDPIRLRRSARLESDAIVVTGYLPRVESHFRAARVFVSPLRDGAWMNTRRTSSDRRCV